MDVFTVKRDPDRYNFPLIERFVHTGEPLNPWRCDCCATQRQRRRIAGEMELFQVNDAGVERPECCRKCGMDWM